MAGSLTVKIIMPQYWDGDNGQWSIPGSGWQEGGATLSGLAAGIYVVSFQPVEGANTPASQRITVNDGDMPYAAFTAGTYATIAPESLLESGCKGLIETPCYALDAIKSPPLFLAASSMDAAFSAYGPGPAAPPIPPYDQTGAAYTAAKVMGEVFDEAYTIMLEGGQVASDFATTSELEAIAAIAAPYLTGSQPYLGGLPIRCGWKTIKRNVDSWVIQRGKGFSLQPAYDAGWVNAGILPYLYYSDVVPAQKTVSGFIVKGNGLTWPTNTPGTCTGMYATNPLNGNSPISGYPLPGGANVSVIGTVAGAVSIHGINGDGTINAAINWYPGYTIPRPNTSVYATLKNTDWYNEILVTSGDQSAYMTQMPPAYFEGSPDWTWVYQPETNTYQLAWNTTNPQVNTLEFALIFWIGKSPSQVPQVNYYPPGNAYGPVNPIPPPPYNPPYTCAPADRNARFNPFAAADYNLFSIQ